MSRVWVVVVEDYDTWIICSVHQSEEGANAALEAAKVNYKDWNCWFDVLTYDLQP